MTESTPQGTLPGEAAAAAESKPREMAAQEEAAMAAAPASTPSAAAPGEAPAMPSMAPPSAEEAAGEAFGAAWHNGKKITALWSINQNRNSWIGVPGVGWKRLAHNSDSAVVALTIVAAHAKLTGGNVNLKEDEGQIKEIYAF